ncbi:MAG: ABC transporter ATP-binding protein [Chloroflexi bacterium]|nr:MAG: ABC transporter ATP-binding protein [Chloroflexota bacterium]
MQGPATPVPILEARSIVKRFGALIANDHVDLQLYPGEVLALLGENGAGKTTLMNVLYGLTSPDEGEVLLDGQPVRLDSPRQAIARGIGMVHQHFMLVPPLTVAENLMLGAESTVGPAVLDLARARRRVRELSTSYGLPVDPDALVRDLPVGVQQRVEILKALYRQARVLILDEPTAVLTPQEAGDLFRVMRTLVTDKRTSIVFITHKLHEVFQVADRIEVLRQGKVVGSLTPREATGESLAAMMVGRPVLLRVHKGPARPGEVVLRLRDLQVLSDRGLPAVDHLSLEVRAGEILGIAGVQGNGQTELVEALTGLRSPVSGSIELLGRDVTHASTRELVDSGAAHIPEDRQKHGLVLSYPVADNLVLRTYERPPFSRGITIVREAIFRYAQRVAQEFDIRARSVRVPAGTLSGGNQQKVIVAREFTRGGRLIVAAQPTRGVDVGSTEFIHRKLVEARDSGMAVLLISAELDEVLSLADRIAVMFRGKIAGLVDTADATPEVLGYMMATGKRPEPNGVPRSEFRVPGSEFRA